MVAHCNGGDLMARTYTRFVQRINQQLVLRTEVGVRLIGSIGVLVDELLEGATQAVRAAWVGDSVGPAADALSAAGEEMSLPRYPRESNEQYEARLERAWDDWPYAGHESSILGQLEAAGFPGAEIYTPADWPLTGLPDWWSQFWVFFPAGTHSVTAAAPEVGSFTVGDGTLIGPVGLSQADLFAIRRIVKKFKPGHYICSGVIFEISGWTIGTGHTVGEPGLVLGGESELVGVP